jgi:UDP-glucose 6-dehydrogenase
MIKYKKIRLNSKEKLFSEFGKIQMFIEINRCDMAKRRIPILEAELEKILNQKLNSSELYETAKIVKLLLPAYKNRMKP